MILDIRKVRNDLGMTRQEFAVKLGCTIATVRNWEEGYNEPTPKYINKIQELDKSLQPDFVSPEEKKLLKTFHIAFDLIRSGTITTADLLDIVYEYVQYKATEKILRKWAGLGFYRFYGSVSVGKFEWDKLPRGYYRLLNEWEEEE